MWLYILTNIMLIFEDFQHCHFTVNLIR